MPILPSKRPLDGNTIAAGIAKSYGYTLGDLQSKLRYRRLVTVRWRVFYALRQQGFSYPEIGELLKRDHSTVIHGVQAWLKLIEGAADEDKAA